MVTSCGILEVPYFWTNPSINQSAIADAGAPIKNLLPTQKPSSSPPSWLGRQTSSPTTSFAGYQTFCLKAFERRPFAHAGVEWHARMVFWELMAIHTHHSPRFPQLPQPPCVIFYEGPPARRSHGWPPARRSHGWWRWTSEQRRNEGAPRHGWVRPWKWEGEPWNCGILIH